MDKTFIKTINDHNWVSAVYSATLILAHNAGESWSQVRIVLWPLLVAQQESFLALAAANVDQADKLIYTLSKQLWQQYLATVTPKLPKGSC